MDEFNSRGKGPFYLFLDKTLYDVTDFSKKHPGGGVIRSLAWTKDDPIDATIAFREFHYRSMKGSDRVAKLIKAMPKAPQELQQEAYNELILNVRKDPRREKHLAMVKEHQELAEKLKSEGYYEGKFRHVIQKWVESIVLFTIGLWLCKHVHWTIGSLLCAAVSQNAFWFLVHEGGHRSFSTYPWLDKCFQFMCFDLFFGASTRFWNLQHNHHHANTQHKTYDVDLHYYPLIYFSRELFTAPGHPPGGRKEAGWWVENQGNTWWFSLVMLQLWYQYWYHVQYNLHKKTYEYFFLGFVVHYSFHYLLLHQYWGFSLPMTFLIMHTYLYVGGCAIFVQSWFAHSYMNIHLGCPPIPNEENPVPRYHYNWIELAGYHTVNVTPTFLVNLFAFVTTCQVEHHLWPSIPESNHNEYTKQVAKDFLKRHNLPYYEQTWWDCLMTVWENVACVGKNIMYEGPFKQSHK